MKLTAPNLPKCESLRTLWKSPPFPLDHTEGTAYTQGLLCVSWTKTFLGKAGKDCFDSISVPQFSLLMIAPKLVPSHITRLVFPSVLTGCFFHMLHSMVFLAGFLQC